MSGYETIQRSGRHVDVGGRVEHDILVDAEHKLLSSLAKARVSNAAETPLVFRKTTLRSRDDPTFQRAAFGDGAAEVRALGDSGPGGRGILRRLEGVAIMKGSRAERHGIPSRRGAPSATTSRRASSKTPSSCASRDSETGSPRATRAWRKPPPRARTCPRLPRPARGGRRGRRRGRRARRRRREEGADDAPPPDPDPFDDAGFAAFLSLEESDVRAAWSAISTELPARLDYIDRLERDVKTASSAAKTQLETSLSHAVDALVAVAHATRPELERFAAAETVALNKARLEDERQMADLTRRLRTREVEKERDELARWTAAFARWRDARVERHVRRFVALVESEAFSDPPERRDALEALARDQRRALESLEAHVAGARKMFALDDPDGDEVAVSGCAMNALSVAAAERWRESLEIRHDAWDRVVRDALDRIDADADALDRASDEALRETRERAMADAGLEATAAATTDAARELAPDANLAPDDAASDSAAAERTLTPAEALEATIEARCVAVAEARKKASRAFRRRVRAGVDAQAKLWRATASRAADFFASVARLLETHRELARRARGRRRRTRGAPGGAREERRRRRARSTTRGRPSRTRRTTPRSTTPARARRRADAVEAEYRAYHRDATEIAESNPEGRGRTSKRTRADCAGACACSRTRGGGGSGGGGGGGGGEADGGGRRGPRGGRGEQRARGRRRRRKRRRRRRRRMRRRRRRKAPVTPVTPPNPRKTARETRDPRIPATRRGRAWRSGIEKRRSRRGLPRRTTRRTGRRARRRRRARAPRTPVTRTRPRRMRRSRGRRGRAS